MDSPAKKKRRKIQPDWRRARRLFQADCLSVFLLQDLANIVLDYLGTGIDGQHSERLSNNENQIHAMMSIGPNNKLLFVEGAQAYVWDENKETNTLMNDIFREPCFHATQKDYCFIDHSGHLMLKRWGEEEPICHVSVWKDIDEGDKCMTIVSDSERICVMRDKRIRMFQKPDLRCLGEVNLYGFPDMTCHMALDRDELFVVTFGRLAIYDFTCQVARHSILGSFLPLVTAFCVVGDEIFAIDSKARQILVLDHGMNQVMRQWSVPFPGDLNAICFNGTDLLASTSRGLVRFF